MGSTGIFRALLIVPLGVLSGCSSLLYHPYRDHVVSKERYGKAVEDVWFSSRDGTKLHAWYLPSKKPAKAVVVLFHGNGENISTHTSSLSWLTDEEFPVFAFDYQGYGKSDGDPSPEGTVEDGKAAVRKITHEKHLPVVIYGQSLGGAIALRAAIEMKGEQPIRGIVADSTFASYRSVGKRVLSRHPITWLFQPLAYVLLSDAHAPKGRIAELEGTPLLVIHGDQDSLVDADFGRQVFEEAREPKVLWVIPGGRHIDVFYRDKGAYRKRFLEWLRTTVAAVVPNSLSP